MAQTQSEEPIAIIGSGCRFPGGCSSPSKLWDLLNSPRDVLKQIPTERFDIRGVYNPDGEYHGSTNVQGSYLLDEDVRLFDAQFFKINPAEAHCIDPQQRILLETVYEGIERAGLTIEQLQGSDTAVYVGQMCEEYSEILARDIDQLPTYFATATGRSIMSNRISYFFDWRGPCMTIDTACSSSLVALHLATQALRKGDCRVAVAAGSNLILGPKPYIAESKLHMLSPNSRSRMWDADADGYARGEGVAAIILKRLDQAIEDGDHIECIVRETNVNQDGHTHGITMPSSTSQERLIRQTYARAGLDPEKEADRCHFFEAHGTGTPAGDPIEAEAIQNAFFGPNNARSGDSLLRVGSIKTVVGHTEGTAGIAAVMKASLALQHGVIPPNMWFEQLSPKVEPFYANLRIESAAQPWPKLASGTPRRASVNSFGFGGTNAHAILETYEPGSPAPSSRAAPTFLPFVLSATSEKSLAAQKHALSEHLKAHDDVNLRDLAFTLISKRSTFSSRWAISATSLESLRAALDSKPNDTEPDPPANLPASARTLGVFTGQGAQWARMGKELIERSHAVRQKLETMDAWLQDLPTADRPSWRLVDELLADGAGSRLGEATISQPACTAVQLVLTDLLRNAGVAFDAVVGHSSGEIAAAYAAGLLSAASALYIAYYRGFHAKLAGGVGRKAGAMLAAGTGLEDAKELCELDDFKGRISVAASNSSSSVTISGDEDAIIEIREILEDEGKFARQLRVNTAYHSHHMAPCAEPYVRSLQACGIKVHTPPPGSPTWYSSVSGKKMGPGDTGLLGDYWRDNMVRPVLFSTALEAALADQEAFGIAFEVGPHPALRGPALQVIEEAAGRRIPYTGVLKRDKNDVEAFGDALGFAWRHFAQPQVDFNGYDELVSEGAGAKALTGLPAYAWDHDRVYWQESRMSRAVRLRSAPVHQLLGTLLPDGVEDGLRWHNVVTTKEVEWLLGHQLQGQAVMPATGFVAMAVEAARVYAEGKEIEVLEIEDFVIDRAMFVDTSSSGVETVLTLSEAKTQSGSGRHIRANVQLHGAAAATADGSALSRFFSCGVRIVLGKPSPLTLPAPSLPLSNTVEVNTDHFYSELRTLGYEYDGPFRALSGMRRMLDRGTACIAVAPVEDRERLGLIHPATLDCAIQAVILAFCWPGDNKLWSIHVPSRIARIRINLALLPLGARPVSLPVDSLVSSDGGISGDVDILAEDGSAAIVQMQGIEVIPFTPATADSDARLFFEVFWEGMDPDGRAMMGGRRASPEDYSMALVYERVSYFYMRHLLDSVTPEEFEAAQWNFRRLRNFAVRAIEHLASGKTKYGDKAWLQDTRAQIEDLMQRYDDMVEIKLLRAVGENMPAAVRGETIILEHMRAGNLLDDFYVKSLGITEYTEFLSRAVRQIAHRYPDMDILEIGAGTGGATKRIVRELERAFSSYTFTDISSGFFEKAREALEDYSDCMVFKTLDAETDPVEQGFIEHSYDLVICSLVLHATKDLDNTMRNVRRLLKPGGFVVMLELTNNRQLRVGFCMGGLPGWWLGSAEDGREYSPCVTANQWNAILRRTGFAGIAAITPDVDPEPWPVSIIAAQAVEETINVLRRPLVFPQAETSERVLVMLGGTSPGVSMLGDELEDLLHGHFMQIVRFETLEDLDDKYVTEGATLLGLTELDEPVFKDLTQTRMSALKSLWSSCKNVLWLTQGCMSDQPYSNMTIGFGRTAVVEMLELRLQFFNVEGPSGPDARLVADMLLRLQVTEFLERRGAGQQILWSVEPEISLQNGRLLIPRVKASKPMNDRYNSMRREMTKELSPSDAIISLSSHTAAVVLEEQPGLPETAATEGNSRMTNIQVHYSLFHSLSAAKIGSYFPVVGTVEGQTDMVVALANENASKVQVPESCVAPCPAPAGLESGFLCFFAAEIVADRIFPATAAPACVLIHEAPDIFGAVLQKRGAERGHSVVLSTSDSASRSAKVVRLQPRMSTREVRAALPRNVSLLLDLSTEDEQRSVAQAVVECMPRGCATLGADSIFTAPATVGLGLLALPSPGLVMKAASLAADDLVGLKAVESAAPVGMGQVLGGFLKQRLEAVVDWKAQATVPVQVEPVDSKMKFKSDATYILFGLTGQLGRSLSVWMARHGARHIVLTSRKPVVDEQWIEDTAKLGARVRVMANDITDRDAVEKLVKHIAATSPPIAGVANGAMVLQDTSIADMTAGAMNTVLRPKVDGSLALHELFSDDTLDFFILFSSLATIFGNHGQSNYTTANMFLNGLAAHRRSRGLAASVIAVGAIMGIGYMSREVSRKDLARIRESGYTTMAERDLHHLFAEGILASRRPAGHCPEVISGLDVSPQSAHRPVTWTKNPVLSHCVPRRGMARARADGTSAGMPVKAQLLDATSREAAYGIVADAFMGKLQAILQLDHPPDPELGIDELGLDSLVAVEVRAWFMREVLSDVPVLKILGATSARAILDYAFEQLPPELVPKLADEPARDSSTSETRSSSDSASGTSPEPPASPESRASRERAASPVIEKDADAKVQRTELMSFAQSRFWFLQNYLPDKCTFNIRLSMSLSGTLRASDLARAVRAVAQRHEALRTGFSSDERGREVQTVFATSPLQLVATANASASDVSRVQRGLSTHVYALASGETMRIELLSHGDAKHTLLVGYHHINMDGISLGVMLSELQRAYARVPQPAGFVQYPDFAARQRKAVAAGKLDAALDFWQREFATMPEPLPLLPFSTTTARRPILDYTAHMVEKTVSAPLAARIRDACRRCRAGPFHIYLAAYAALLTRVLGLGGGNDLVVGMGDANRLDADVAGALGVFLNLLPLRFALDRGDASAASFAGLVKAAQRKVRAALAHSAAPFDLLLERLSPPRGPEFAPLMQAFIDYRPPLQGKQTFCGCRIDNEQYERGGTAFDVALDIIDTPAGDARLIMQVPQALYQRQDADTLMGCYLRLLDAFARDPEASVWEPPLFRRADVDSAIRLGAGPSPAHAWPATLPERVDAIAAQHASRLALKDGSATTLTYAQLRSRAAAIGAELAARGVRPGDVVAVLTTPSNAWACAVHAVLRAGAVYVPLDSRIPLARLASIVADSGSRAILVESNTAADARELASPHGIPVIDVSVLDGKAGGVGGVASVSPGAAAVILYTSGTTGTPKGVVLRHANLVNAAAYAASLYGVDEAATVLQQTAASFDISLWQLLVAGSTGARLVVASAEQRRDPAAIAGLIVDERVSHVASTPAEYDGILAAARPGGGADALRDSAWRIAMCGGEAMTEGLKARFRGLGNAQLRLFNAYGPAEVTFWSHVTEVELCEEGHGSVGRPIAGTATYILDGEGSAVPAGAAGEIAVGGAGVAAGYVGQQSGSGGFVEDPFATDDAKQRGWTRMYRTGDKGVMRDDGTLVFLGRIEGGTQIKLRGIRIDLRDVERNLVDTSSGALADAVVTLRGSEGAQFLAAHVVLDKKQAAGEAAGEAVDDVLNRLAADLPLPQYMRPAVVVPLEQIPLTTSGKIDRRAVARLPLPQSLPAGQSAGQLSADEAKMLGLWRLVLPDEMAHFHSVTAASDFFHVGGNSVLLVRLQKTIQKTLGASVSLVKLFESSTLGAMAAEISPGGRQKTADIDWDDETALTDQLSVLLNSSTNMAPPRAEPRVVVLTGATGFLGRALLRRLIDTPGIERIHCIAVRNLPQRQLAPILTHSKVRLHAGDLAAPRLGLSAADAAAIFNAADAVVHNGAGVSFMKTYSSLRAVNVGSTRALLALALPRRLPFHYVSSASVARLARSADAVHSASMARFCPPVDGSDGYTASKWASEVLVEQCAVRAGCPAVVHRPSSIMGEGAADTDLMANLLRYSLQLGSVPALRGGASDNDGPPSFVDMIDVERVAQGVVERVCAQAPAGAPVRYVYHSGELVIPVVGLGGDEGGDEGDGGFTSLPLEQWVDRAVHEGMNPLVGAFLQSAADRPADALAMFPKLVKD